MATTDSSTASSQFKHVDLEKNPSIDEARREPEIRHGSVTPAFEVARARHIQNAIAPLRFLSRGEVWLDKKMGIETQGIDRIPEEEKRPPHLINTFLMWWSMTCHVGKYEVVAASFSSGRSATTTFPTSADL